MSEALAKLVWNDPRTNEKREFVLVEGATATIGRSSNNDIQIAEQHVSRQHAVISFREGVFMVNDLGSSNGTFVNDQKIEEPFPLFAGDCIRLYVPELRFTTADATDADAAQKTGRLIVPTSSATNAVCSLTVTNGPQEGQTFALLLDEVKIGRATTNATWEIMLQDPSVSRPHARLQRQNGVWAIYDLGSSNGTAVNGTPVTGDKGHPLKDGDTLRMGGSVLLFRIGWTGSLNAPHDASMTLPPIR